MIILFMSMLGYLGCMYFIIEDTAKRHKQDSQGLVKATLWVICVLSGLAFFGSLLRNAA